jgi:hypothetical protein
MEMEASIGLHKRFIKGLLEYNLTEEEVIKNWKYCGGNRKEHFNYFKLSCPGEDFPAQVNECVCRHYIEENCYITNGEEILILGNCCIKKFLTKSGRTCEDCGEPHQNRIIDKCNNCRPKTISKNRKTCEDCSEPHQNRKVNRCNSCRIGRCDECPNRCPEKYKLCFMCHNFKHLR